MAALETRSSPKPQGAIDTALAEVAARVRSQRRLRGGTRGLIAALVLDIVLAVLFRADLLPGSLPLIPTLLTVALIGAVLGGFLASRRMLSPMDAARLAEAHLPLKERLSSALEFDRSSRPNPLLSLQHADADTHARALEPRLVAPCHAPRELWVAAFLLLLLILTLGLPNLPFALTSAQRGERQTVRAAGRQLQDAAHAAFQQADARHDGAAKREAHKIEALGKRMSQGHMDRAQAMAAVSQQEQQAAGAANDSPVSNDPSQAAKSLAGALSSSAPPSSAASKPAPGASAKPGVPSTKATAGKSPASAPHGSGQTASAQSKPAATQSKPGSTHPSSSPSNGARDSQSTRGKEAAARAQAGGTLPKSGAPELHQALENAHRQLSGANPSPAHAPNTTPSSTPPSGKASPHSPSSAGKPNGASQPNSAGKSSGQGQPSHGTPGGASHSAGKGQNGAPGQGKIGHPTSGAPGSASNQPAPGGGAGSTAKMPFHAALPPTIVSKNQGLYLGAPHQKPGAGATLRRQPGQPDPTAQPSRVPYGQALPRYRKSAEAALDQERVPPSQRAVVRNYFKSLQPAK